MMVIFGGRGADGQPMNDTWGLRKHRDNRFHKGRYYLQY